MAKINKKYSGIGGQAVMEGIMMKNKDDYAVCVRKSDGTIEIKKDVYNGVFNGSFSKIPFIRGVFAFVDSLVLGMSTLTWSASLFEDEVDENNNSSDDKKSGNESLLMGLTVAFSIVMAVAIFIMLPYFLSELIRKFIDNTTYLAIIEGVLRLAIFIGYVSIISLMKEIKRVYQYHGAEHKCINCIEHGNELTVDNVMASSRLHMRCGTSFLLFVMFVSIILFLFIRTDSPILRIVIRLLLIPVISGISYEIIRLAGKSDNIFVKVLSFPGLMLQKITTKEPDRDQVEVAIKSVEEVFDWREYLKEAFSDEL